ATRFQVRSVCLQVVPLPTAMVLAARLRSMLLQQFTYSRIILRVPSLARLPHVIWILGLQSQFRLLLRGFLGFLGIFLRTRKFAFRFLPAFHGNLLTLLGLFTTIVFDLISQVQSTG